MSANLNNTEKSLPRITSLRIGRLFSTGDYGNVKYEFTVDIPLGNSPVKILQEMETVLDGLNPNPPSSAHDLHGAMEVAKKPFELDDAWATRQHRRAVELIQKHDDWNTRRTHAHVLLEMYGGNVTVTDPPDREFE